VVCATCTEHYDPIRTRVLVVKLAAMGDVLRTTSLLPAIHRRWPGSHLTWVTAPASVPLLADNPAIDRVVSFAGTVPLPLLAERFDVVLNTDADPDACSLSHVARTPVRVGFAFDETHAAPVPLSDGARAWLSMGVRDDLKRANRRPYQELMAEVLEVDYRREPPQLPLRPEHLLKGAALREQHAPGGGGLLVGLNTGAGGRWRFKRWTEEGYRALVAALGERGHRVFLLGGPEEVERNRRLAEGSGGVAVDTGCDNSVSVFGGIVSACDVVVTGDTLAMHVAIAREVPVVVLFGPTSLHEIDVFDRGRRLAPDLDCLCCYKMECDFVPNCMESITVDEVLAATLEAASPAPRGA
jgi:heptosyltransferase-2